MVIRNPHETAAGVSHECPSHCSVLALFSLVSTATGGYLYYHSAKESAVKEAEVDLVAKSQLLNDRIVNLISANHMEARALALFEELQEALIRPNRETLAQANRVLDHFSDGQDGEVSYLVDNAGNTIASSNRQEPESFVGKNYAFRPYFQEAIQGYCEYLHGFRGNLRFERRLF